MEGVHSQMKKQKREENIIPISRMLGLFNRATKIRKIKRQRFDLTQILGQEIAKLIFVDFPCITSDEAKYSYIKIWLESPRDHPGCSIRYELMYRIKTKSVDRLIIRISVYGKDEILVSKIDMDEKQCDNVHDLYQKTYDSYCTISDQMNQSDITLPLKLTYAIFPDVLYVTKTDHIDLDSLTSLNMLRATLYH